ncbi:MAG: hypothetical protein ACI9FO_000598 [Methylophagaceae bacterium]|jgi:hypothetical protein
MLVAVAILFNYLFSWRRYPVHLSTIHFQSLPHPVHLSNDITLTTEDLTELLELAKQHHRTSQYN